MTSPARHIGEDINLMMAQELGVVGSSILKKQCAELDIDIKSMSVKDLQQLAGRLRNVVAPVYGLQKAQTIERHVLRFQLLFKAEMSGGSAELFLELANISRFLGELEEGLEYVNTARELLDKIDGRKAAALRAEMHEKAGWLYLDKNELLSARREMEMANELFSGIKDLNGQSRASRGLSKVHWLGNDYKLSRLLAEHAMEIDGSDINRARAGTELGVILTNLGELDKAIETFLECEKVLLKQGAILEQVQFYNNLARVYTMKEDWEGAVKYYESNLRISEKANFFRGQAFTSMNLGEAYAETGRYREAEERLDKALELFQELGDRRCLGFSHRNMGILFRKKEEWLRAEKEFQTSLEIQKEIGNDYGVADTLEDMAKMYIFQRDLLRADHVLSEAIGLFKMIGAQGRLERASKIKKGVNEIPQPQWIFELL